MCGLNRGGHFTEVRRAAIALSRAVERRAPALATSKWWKEERHGVFLDYNQNAKDRTTCSAYSVRPLADARVSTPLHWDEVPDCDPADFTVLTIPERFAEMGDPHADMDAAAGSLEELLELAHEGRGGGAGRCAVAAALSQDGRRSAAGGALAGQGEGEGSADEDAAGGGGEFPGQKAALAGLERWKSKHGEAAKLLAVDDVLVDSMRGGLPRGRGFE